jgi:hypothetical protein
MEERETLESPILCILKEATGMIRLQQIWRETTDQITQAILARVELFFEAEKNKLYIDENGTIFDFQSVKVILLEGKTFSIDGTTVTLGGLPLVLSRIKSEGIVRFSKCKNGDTQLADGIDSRQGKGIFIDTAGKIYRA